MMRFRNAAPSRLIATCCLIASLAAAFAANARCGERSPLRIATFQVDATPPLGCPLCNGAVQPAKQIVDRLTARGIVLLGDGLPIVLCAVDWLGIANGGHDSWQEALASAAGTSPDRVSVHALHQHDVPGCDFEADEILTAHGLGGRMFNVPFARQTIDRAAAALREALKNPRAVSQIGLGQARVYKVASSRRLLGPDGKIKFVRWSGNNSAEVRAVPEGTIDPDVRAISFWDGDRPVAVLTFYATHPMSIYGKGGVTHDFVGEARRVARNGPSWRCAHPFRRCRRRCDRWQIQRRLSRDPARTRRAVGGRHAGCLGVDASCADRSRRHSLADDGGRIADQSKTRRCGGALVR